MGLIVPPHVAVGRRAKHAGRPYGVVRVRGQVVAHIKTRWFLSRAPYPIGFSAWRDATDEGPEYTRA